MLTVKCSGKPENKTITLLLFFFFFFVVSFFRINYYLALKMFFSQDRREPENIFEGITIMNALFFKLKLAQ